MSDLIIKLLTDHPELKVSLNGFFDKYFESFNGYYKFELNTSCFV